MHIDASAIPGIIDHLTHHQDATDRDARRKEVGLLVLEESR